MIKLTKPMKYAIILYLILIITLLLVKPKLLNIDDNNSCKKYIIPLIAIIGAIGFVVYYIWLKAPPIVSDLLGI